MKIAVIGAAGMVGKEIVQEATTRGLNVAPYTRTGSGGATAVEFADTPAVVDIINSHDVTIISVAGRDDYEAVVRAHEALIVAQPTGRFIVIGGAGGLQVGDGLLVDAPGFPEGYKAESRAFVRVLQAYQASTGLQWTVIAPSSEIAPGSRTGNYVTAADTPAGDFVSTQDFAVAVVDEAVVPQWIAQRFTVASAEA
ncbi:NAD(P)-dependent oxidoreductase [Corynebacterium lizhenjunii]|uniref:NAD(P)-dependent oxidoreductase n=1 Tax=Corynebacterium lizhenjunii TaxID=2709394 RepID=UPI0013EADE5D|nr:NAD(P)H-binding protein [Corynebacterium lizhenjunii]